MPTKNTGYYTFQDLEKYYTDENGNDVVIDTKPNQPTNPDGSTNQEYDSTKYFDESICPTPVNPTYFTFFAKYSVNRQGGDRYPGICGSISGGLFVYSGDSANWEDSTFLYEDEALTTPVSDGFYRSNDSNGNSYYLEVISGNGEVSSNSLSKGNCN